MKLFQNRTIGFWITLVAAVIAVLGDVVFAIADRGDQTFSWATFFLILLGAIGGIAALFTDSEILSLLSSFCYAAGIGVHLVVGLPSVSDLWNHVNFIGGNGAFVILFGGIFLLSGLLSCVSNFLKQKKDA